MMNQTEKHLKVETLFSTPIIRARHPQLDALLALLKQIVLDAKANAAGVSRSNQGGWHSQPNMEDWGGVPAQTLVSFAAGLVEQHIHASDVRHDLKIGWGVDMWANVNAAGDSNAQHCHPGAFASAVFYLDLGNGHNPAKDGQIVFEDPRFPMAHMQHPNVLWRTEDGGRSQYALLPSAGEMVIFPSWLRHSVKPHSGAGERISIAMNLTLLWQPKGAEP